MRLVVHIHGCAQLEQIEHRRFLIFAESHLYHVFGVAIVRDQKRPTHLNWVERFKMTENRSHLSAPRHTPADLARLSSLRVTAVPRCVQCRPFFSASIQ